MSLGGVDPMTNSVKPLFVYGGVIGLKFTKALHNVYTLFQGVPHVCRESASVVTFWFLVRLLPAMGKVP